MVGTTPASSVGQRLGRPAVPDNAGTCRNAPRPAQTRSSHGPHGPAPPRPPDLSPGNRDGRCRHGRRRDDTERRVGLPGAPAGRRTVRWTSARSTPPPARSRRTSSRCGAPSTSTPRPRARSATPPPSWPTACAPPGSRSRPVSVATASSACCTAPAGAAPSPTAPTWTRWRRARRPAGHRHGHLCGHDLHTTSGSVSPRCWPGCGRGSAGPSRSCSSPPRRTSPAPRRCSTTACCAAPAPRRSTRCTAGRCRSARSRSRPGSACRAWTGARSPSPAPMPPPGPRLSPRTS